MTVVCRNVISPFIHEIVVVNGTCSISKPVLPATQLEIWQPSARDDYSVYILVVSWGFVMVRGVGQGGWRLASARCTGRVERRCPLPAPTGVHAAGVSWGSAAGLPVRLGSALHVVGILRLSVLRYYQSRELHGQWAKTIIFTLNTTQARSDCQIFANH